MKNFLQAVTDYAMIAPMFFGLLFALSLFGVIFGILPGIVVAATGLTMVFGSVFVVIIGGIAEIIEENFIR